MAANRRGRIFINPSFQWKFLLYLNGVLLLLMLFMDSLVLSAAESLAIHKRISFDELRSLQAGLLPWLFLTNFSVHFFTSIVMLFVSHRIAGPIERFKQVIRSLSRDEYFAKEIRLRNHDYFMEVKDLFNELNTKMRKDYIHHQDLIDQLKELYSQGILDVKTKERIQQIVAQEEQYRSTGSDAASKPAARDLNPVKQAS